MPKKYTFDEIWELYSDQGWNDATKLNLLQRYIEAVEGGNLPRVSAEGLDDWLNDLVTAEEEQLAETNGE